MHACVPGAEGKARARFGEGVHVDAHMHEVDSEQRTQYRFHLIAVHCHDQHCVRDSSHAPKFRQNLRKRECSLADTQPDGECAARKCTAT